MVPPTSVMICKVAFAGADTNPITPAATTPHNNGRTDIFIRITPYPMANAIFFVVTGLVNATPREHRTGVYVLSQLSNSQLPDDCQLSRNWIAPEITDRSRVVKVSAICSEHLRRRGGVGG